MIELSLLPTLSISSVERPDGLPTGVITAFRLPSQPTS
jgi:hypothetical protein